MESTMTALYITERDIEALARLAYAEARNIARATGDLKAAYGSIAEAVMNRAMSGEDYLGSDDLSGDITISGVIDKPWQYSPINGIETWENLPSGNCPVTASELVGPFGAEAVVRK